MVRDPDDHSLDSALEKIKQSLHIDKPNSEMADEEIRLVIRKFGEVAPDTTGDENGTLVFGPIAIDIMLTITLYYFPKYYEKFQLSQPQ